MKKLTFLQWLEQRIASSTNCTDDNMPDVVADKIAEMSEEDLFIDRCEYVDYIHDLLLDRTVLHDYKELNKLLLSINF